MSAEFIEQLIKRFSKLPGLGPSSSKKLVLHLLQEKDDALRPLINHLNQADEYIQTCQICGNLDISEICHICTSEKRSSQMICVVEQVGDLWAVERMGSFTGKYHILGGVLSAIDGVMPEDLRLHQLKERCINNQTEELIIATSATVGGQATAHYIASQFEDVAMKISILAQGVPLGGELDWLDEGTISTAFHSRHQMNLKND